MGRRINLAALAEDQVLDAPVPVFAKPVSPITVEVAAVALNPLNPREHFGDLSDLASMKTIGQLQPCAVVTRAAFLDVYPEHETAVGAVEYIVVAGSRRRAAAEHYGLATLSISVMDHLAESRADFYAAAVAENIDRKNFDVLEEARAVQQLAQEVGSGLEAGEILGKSKGWVSQRLALLKLSPDMQDLLRAGEIPVREARQLGTLPPQEQLPTWQQRQRDAQAAKEAEILSRFTVVNPAPTGSDPETASKPVSETASPEPGARSTPRAARISFSEEATPQEIADLLRGRLASETLQALIGVLAAGLPR